MATGRRKQFPTQCKRNGCAELTHEVYCEDHAEFRHQADKSRASAAKRGYNARWRRYRKYFLSKHPLCVECGGLATVVDHRIPHKGDYELFWRTDLHQSMCESCHNAKTASEDMDGWNTHKGLT